VGRVSTEKVTEPWSVSKRKAKEGKTGPCGTGTPLVGARELREALGDRAKMVTADQGGHGVYPFGANTCANDAVTAFLVDGKRPEKDLACKARPSVGRAAGQGVRTAGPTRHGAEQGRAEGGPKARR
jgi:hypothetical protein